jgi:hypothetical protein
VECPMTKSIRHFIFMTHFSCHPWRW